MTDSERRPASQIPLQKVTARKVISRRGPELAILIARRRIERFCRRHDLAAVTDMTVTWSGDIPTGREYMTAVVKTAPASKVPEGFRIPEDSTVVITPPTEEHQ